MKTYKGKGLKLGGGGQFAKMVDAMKKKGMPVEMAKATAANIGRKKYGKAKFQKLASIGKKKSK